ncbi:putative leucine-rich repeat-containing protein DDB_G0290503 isoform X12 [Dendroctonus ponderosae]|uniref:Uncharacterized protein n=1 Tax=Dendroctonus ponderosae TaxID=77166 RepID=A0AAR5PL90_DENPD|nr:putative leucine-rich repeat-containing protein DDB_G0290503 isoform X12 [Dendroctonus ponderosae]
MYFENDSTCPRSNSKSQGCPVPVGNTICGETNSLEIMKQFNRLYEERMEQVDSEAGGDCLQEKIKLQQEWIRNLCQQNEMLVRAVQELEFEATERVHQLEDKLQKSAQCLCDVMKKYREHDFAADLLAEPLQKITHLEDDVRNLLEFIKRIRENQDWSLDGLFFYNISERELLGTTCKFANKFSKDDSLEGEKLLNEKDRTVHELTQKLDYFNSFGDVEAIAKELQARREECDSLKQEMAEIRQALTEEVATKYDEIVLLRKDVQIFEERCMQADKQTAFKEDIIRELRKEIKQLKQQFTQEEIGKLNCTIEELKTNLEECQLAQIDEEKAYRKEIALLHETISSMEAELRDMESKLGKEGKTCKICRGKSKVGFLESTEVQASFDDQELGLMQEANATRLRMQSEIERKSHEIQTLRGKVEQLESSLRTCEERASNLQEAVALYSNSVSVLETTGEESKLQIQQQKVTISNLQQALVEAKQEADEMRKKTQDNETKRQEIVALLKSVMAESEEDSDLLRMQAQMVEREYEILQDLNFTLEVEHCDSLQDMEALEGQLKKYQYLFNIKEEQMRKLSKQKRCYEEVVAYFKHEMGLMADQLNNLQELLTLSNETAQEESSKVMNAFFEVQSINEKLSSQLCACEQQVQLENQMGQLQEAKICQLQQLVKEKELDLSKHDQAIVNIRQTLNDSLKQNADLQLTVAELNETIGSLQGSIRQYEEENCASRRSCLEFQQQIGGYCSKLDELKEGLEQKTAECLKLEMAYNNEKRALKAAQKQLQETDKMQQIKQKELINSLQEAKMQLACSDENNSKLCEECDKLQAQLTNLSRKEAVKDQEIKRYRKIVGDLKATMMELNTELNKNLAQKELKASCKNVNCRRNLDKDDLKDICVTCPCEVEFYQKMVDILKKSVSDLKKQLNDAQQKCKALQDEVKEKELQLNRTKEDLKNQQLDSGKKITSLQQEIDRLTQELQLKSLQLTDVKKSANEINGSKCVQLACAQEEIAHLKNEIASILSGQNALNRENEDLLAEAAQLHCTINCLKDKSKLFKDQADQYALRLKSLSAEKDTLLRKNKELLSELKAIQSMTCSVDKHHRLSSETVKQLEADIEELKNNKDDICSESKSVIKNVRAWVLEQKRINAFVAQREREYIETINRLNSVKQMSSPKPISAPNRGCRANRGSVYNPMCASPCSLGSQGTTSIYDRESPPASPDFGVGNEWYSTTFRAESDNDSGEDYCVNTLEHLTQQMRNSNKVWMSEKRSLRDCRVSKDAKERK